MGTSIGLLGVGLTAGGQQGAGEANKELNKYNRHVAAYQSQDAIRRGKEAEKRFRQEADLLLGEQKVSLAAQNIDIDDDSALDVLADTAVSAEIDAITIRNNARREAWGYQVQGVDYRLRGQIAQTQGNLQAAGTILTQGSRLIQEG